MTTTSQRPNIVLILADDMGYSDLGCYGSEIRTPNLDGLAAEGLRFSQMYNFARCCPSCAALLTGLYPHQAGIGHMAGGIPNAPGYGGYLRHSAVTIAQVLKERGYRTLMSGKWHCGKRPDSTDIPPEMQHGFDRLFGLGRNSGYFGGRTCTLDGEPIAANPTDFYLTDAISNHAVDFISEVSYPAEYDGHTITPLEGESFLSLLKGREWSREKPMSWEHEGNAAIRIGPWKLVCETSGQGDWELYNMDEDRTELNNLAEREEDRVRKMEQRYREWADRADVLPWPINSGAWRFPGMSPDGTFYMRGQHGHMV